MSIKRMVICDQCLKTIGPYNPSTTAIDPDIDDHYHVCRECASRNVNAGPWKASGTGGKEMW